MKQSLREWVQQSDIYGIRHKNTIIRLYYALFLKMIRTCNKDSSLGYENQRECG
jgi:hypothetical protein